MFELPQTTIKHIAVNENIGRIAVDGEHKGKQVSIVIEPGEVPKKIKTSADMQAFLLKKLEEKAEEEK